MSDRDTLGSLAEQLALVFDPLAVALESPEALRDFLEILGWQFEIAPLEIMALKDPIKAVVDSVAAGDVDPGKVSAAFQAISNLTKSNDDFLTEFSRQIVDFLVADYLMREQPRWGFLLAAVGLVRYSRQGPQGNRIEYLRREVGFQQLGEFFSDPLTFFKNRYRWGHSDFDGEQFVGAVEGFLEEWGLTVRDQLVSDAMLGHLKSGALSPDDSFDVMLRGALIENAVESSVFEAGVGLFLLPETAVDKPGFALLPFATDGFDQAFALSENLTLQFKGDVDLTGGVGVLIRPNKELQFFAGLETGTPSALTADLSLALRLGEPGDPILILGSPDGSRLELGGVSTTAGARFRGSLEAFVEFALEGGNVVVKPSSDESDGFVSRLLPSGGLEATFDLVVGFSTTNGLYFGGSGRFEIDFPVNLAVGPIEVESVALAIRPKGSDIPIDLTATLTGDFSVVKATIEQIGLTAAFTFPTNRAGNLGPIDLQLKFHPPTGVGIAINAGPISGGGFISHVGDRYSGVLELSIYSIAVKAFGVIDTKLPGDAEGFSFVILISAEFQPIQLGLGFTLNGVGGLLGINRTLSEEGLNKAFAGKGLQQLLFPKNVTQDAPQIIEGLATVFPAAEDKQVFGPMAKLGWGSPNLVTADLALILSLPERVLTVLGIVDVALPKAGDADRRALVDLHMVVKGVLDFPKSFFSLDAALTQDSAIGGYPVGGQMAMRIRWGDRPNFLLSMGGFNSAFRPPPDFPSLQRMTVDLGIRGDPNITLAGYLAVTSNSVQVGGELDVSATGYGITLNAFLKAEAIFVFAPFKFTATIDAGVHIDFLGVGFSVGLHGRLSGPSPWHIEAKVCASLWFTSACLPVNVTIGEKREEALDSLDPWQGTNEPAPAPKNVIGLRDALEDPRNWTPIPGASTLGVVSLAAPPKTVSGVGTTLVDPLDAITVRQRVVPLETDQRAPIRRFGPVKSSGSPNFKLQSGTVGTSRVPLSKKQTVSDWFAPAQYFELGDTKTISAPSFERYVAGYTFDVADELLFGSHESRNEITFETFIIDSKQPNRAAELDLLLQSEILAGLQPIGPAALFGVVAKGQNTYVDFAAPQRFEIQDPRYIVTDRRSLQVVGVFNTPATKTEALVALAIHLQEHLEHRNQLQVTRFVEAGAS